MRRSRNALFHSTVPCATDALDRLNGIASPMTDCPHPRLFVTWRIVDNQNLLSLRIELIDGFEALLELSRAVSSADNDSDRGLLLAAR